MPDKMKKGLCYSLCTCLLGILLWGDITFFFIGLGVIILGINLLYYINNIYKYKIEKNNKKSKKVL